MIPSSAPPRPRNPFPRRPPVITYSSVSSRPSNVSFYRAVAANDVATVRRILRDPRCRTFLDLKARVECGQTPAALAASAGHVEILDLLLRQQQQPGEVNEACDDRGNTALHLSAANGRAEAVRVILRSQAVDVTVKNKLGQTPVMLARAGLARKTSVGAEQSLTYLGYRQCLMAILSHSSGADAVNTSSVERRKIYHKPISPPEFVGPMKRPPSEERSVAPEIQKRCPGGGDVVMRKQGVAASTVTAGGVILKSSVSSYDEDEDVKSIEVYEVSDSDDEVVELVSTYPAKRLNK